MASLYIPMGDRMNTENDPAANSHPSFVNRPRPGDTFSRDGRVYTVKKPPPERSSIEEAGLYPATLTSTSSSDSPSRRASSKLQVDTNRKFSTSNESLTISSPPAVKRSSHCQQSPSKKHEKSAENSSLVKKTDTSGTKKTKSSSFLRFFTTEEPSAASLKKYAKAVHANAKVDPKDPRAAERLHIPTTKVPSTAIRPDQRETPEARLRRIKQARKDEERRERGDMMESESGSIAGLRKRLSRSTLGMKSRSGSEKSPIGSSVGSPVASPPSTRAGSVAGPELGW
jgi:hypothetical protein